jgi:glycosyltransferase involved in cell wall biosynthesis
VVLHDYFESAEGGGRLSLALARGLGADLAYGFKSPGHPFFADGFPGHELDLACRSDIPLWRQLRLARAFESRTGFLGDYATAVFSGSYAPLAVRGRPAGRNVLYCHTPPRFLYDQREHFLSLVPFWQRPVLSAFLAWLRPRYEDAVSRMDVIAANSENVRGRIQTYLGRESVVVHPPCETEQFKWLGQEDFYLSAARLDALKRVDVVIEAFTRLAHKKLVVISDGPERAMLKALAKGHPNIEIKGLVSEEDYARLTGHCIASVYIPRDEDFGMTPVEAMAAGKPVIGVAEGGLNETVMHGETGVLLPPDPGPEEVAQAVQELTPRKALSMRDACRKRAAGFGVDVFMAQMRDLIA